MRLNKIIFACLLLFLFFMSGAGWCAAKRLFTDSSKPVEVKKGEDFILAAESNPATGYTWEVAGAAGAPQLKFIGSNYQPAKPGTVGQAGVEWFRFLALDLGETEIRLDYRRAWEKDKPPAKEVKFKVRIS